MPLKPSFRRHYTKIGSSHVLQYLTTLKKRTSDKHPILLFRLVSDEERKFKKTVTSLAVLARKVSFPWQ
jgi:hypothetical protein